MERQEFSRYVFPITTRDGDIRYVVAGYNVEYRIYFHDLTPREHPWRDNITCASRDVSDLPSYPTRRQALRHARYLYGTEGSTTQLFYEKLSYVVRTLALQKIVLSDVTKSLSLIDADTVG